MATTRVFDAEGGLVGGDITESISAGGFTHYTVVNTSGATLRGNLMVAAAATAAISVEIDGPNRPGHTDAAANTATFAALATASTTDRNIPVEVGARSYIDVRVANSGTGSHNVLWDIDSFNASHPTSANVGKPVHFG